jgi:hypothetical protein
MRRNYIKSASWSIVGHFMRLAMTMLCSILTLPAKNVSLS